MRIGAHSIRERFALVARLHFVAKQLEFTHAELSVVSGLRLQDLKSWFSGGTTPAKTENLQLIAKFLTENPLTGVSAKEINTLVETYVVEHGRAMDVRDRRERLRIRAFSDAERSASYLAAPGPVAPAPGPVAPAFGQEGTPDTARPPAPLWNAAIVEATRLEPIEDRLRRPRRWSRPRYLVPALVALNAAVLGAVLGFLIGR